MIRRLFRCLLVAGGLAAVALPCLAAPPAPPTIPDALKPATVAVAGTRLSLGSGKPLTAEQLDAVEEVVAAAKIRTYVLSGQAGNDDLLARLVKHDPESLQFFGGPFTEAGAAHFAAMKSLKYIGTSHAGSPSAKAAAALASHPSLESFASDGFGTHGMEHIASARSLREIVLQHGLSSDANVRLFERHPSLEKIWLWPHGPYGILTDAAIASLATLPKLKDLKLDYSRFTYDGGLKHLKNVPTLEKLSLGSVIVSDADLTRLKADLPNVKITVTPMDPATQRGFERAEAMRDMPAVLKAVGCVVGADPVDGTRTMLMLSSTASPTAEQWAAIEPLREKFGIRAFGLSGRAGDDAAVSRLAAYDPTTLVLTSCPVTDAGLAHVAGMKSLRGLHLSNCAALTPAAAAIVKEHPTISNLVLPPAWANDPATFRAVLAMPRLTGIVLSQGQASDATCGLLARHPALEQLTLSPQGTAGLTNASLAALATVPTLTKLSISNSRLSYDGGLEHLTKLPALASLTLSNVLASKEDIDRLKAALPKTTVVTFAAMSPAAVAGFEKLEAARRQAVELAKLQESERAAKLAEFQKADPAAGAAIQAELKLILPAGPK